jgi:2-dehydro-3-deoxyglucarate aldolase/4-hydroxy-2-oxoheptanedioate aldolase
MKPNPLRAKLHDGGVARGLMISEVGTLGALRIAEAAGVDFALFDQEHTSWTVDHIRTLLAAARASRVPALVRVPEATRHFIASALDAGAAGIMVPMVETDAAAREIVALAKFPPMGRRGFGALYADEYVQGDVTETLVQSNREQLVIAQIETQRGIENVESIAAVDGIDMLWIGHFDLTISLGIAGRFDSARYHRAVQRLIAAASANGKPAAIAAPSGAQAAAELARGFRCVALDDVSLLESALRDALESLSASRPDAP